MSLPTLIPPGCAITGEGRVRQGSQLARGTVLSRACIACTVSLYTVSVVDHIVD